MEDAEIDRLIRVPKRITEPPSKDWRSDLANRRKDFRLVSESDELNFRAFARQNIAFPENFSIGLEYEPKDSSDTLILLRCNGPHGEYNGQMTTEHPHFHPHIHRATEAAIAAGQRPEKHATRTTEFINVKEAMRFFLNEVNVSKSDQNQYFADDLVMMLFDQLGDTE